MDEKKQKAIKSLENEIGRIREQIERIKNLPDNLPGEITATFCSTLIYLPYNLQVIRETRAMLGRDFGLTHKPGVDVDGDWVASLRGKGENWSNNVLIIASANRAGSTCRKVQKGTRQVPVYEIVCDDEMVAA